MLILYEDNHLFAVNKPAGLLTQPSGTSQESLEGFCKAWIKEKYQKPGNVYLEAAHRLDKPVSGVVLFARTSKALSRLHEVLRERRATKIYIALVDQAPRLAEGALEHFLIHGEHKAEVISAETPGAQLARLYYKTIGKNLLQITLETGRYHQIRAQLAAIGSPIVGDLRYGSKKNLEKDQIALHHLRLEIKHPVSQVPLVLEAPAPPWASGG